MEYTAQSGKNVGVKSARNLSSLEYKFRQSQKFEDKQKKAVGISKIRNQPFLTEITFDMKLNKHLEIKT